ncbi:MAG: InlB B-repeat-containing protein, partial [Clostridia bacterium]|nr:InlB B-repeat-containing protein [Clostridia bacterium]
MKKRALALLLSFLMITSMFVSTFGTSVTAAGEAIGLFDVTSAVLVDGTLTVRGSAVAVSDSMSVSVMLYDGVTDGNDPSGSGNLAAMYTYSYGDIMTGDSNSSTFVITRAVDAAVLSSDGAVYVGIKTTSNTDAVCYGGVSSYIYYDLNAEDANAVGITSHLLAIGEAYKTRLTSKTPTRPGYRFNGWTDADGVAVSSAATMAPGGVTVYASWTATDFYDISFIAGENGTLTGGVQTKVTYGKTWAEAITSLPTPVPVNSDYVFAYWYPEIPADDYVIDSDMSFTAVFLRDDASSQSLIEIDEAFYKNGSVTVNGKVNSVSQSQWDVAFTVYGDVEDESDVGASFGSSVVALRTVKLSDIIDEDTNEFSYTFKADADLFTGLVYVGAKFVTVDFDTAAYAPVTADIVLDKNSDDAVAGDVSTIAVNIGAVMGAIGDEATPTRAGHSFEGWKYADGTEYDETAIMGSDGITLYAQWAAAVMFSASAGGSLSGETSFTVITGTAFSEIAPTPVAEYGYKFEGWSPALPETVTESANYTAIFVKDESLWHTIKFVSAVGGYLEGT